MTPQPINMCCLEGAHNYDDYDSEYEREHPELGFTDAQVEAEVEKLNSGGQEIL